jgi:hypothetical protein
MAALREHSKKVDIDEMAKGACEALTGLTNVANTLGATLSMVVALIDIVLRDREEIADLKYRIMRLEGR